MRTIAIALIAATITLFGMTASAQPDAEITELRVTVEAFLRSRQSEKASGGLLFPEQHVVSLRESFMVSGRTGDFSNTDGSPSNGF